jgi:hypothetical protein
MELKALGKGKSHPRHVTCVTKYVPPEHLTTIRKQFQLLKRVYLKYQTVGNVYKVSC